MVMQIEKEFIARAKGFITEIYDIEGKELPSFTSDDHIRIIFNMESSKLFDQLMWHRNSPIPLEKLEKIKAMKYLPKQCRFIFE